VIFLNYTIQGYSERDGFQEQNSILWSKPLPFIHLSKSAH